MRSLRTPLSFCVGVCVILLVLLMLANGCGPKEDTYTLGHSTALAENGVLTYFLWPADDDHKEGVLLEVDTTECPCGCGKKLPPLWKVFVHQEEHPYCPKLKKKVNAWTDAPAHEIHCGCALPRRYLAAFPHELQHALHGDLGER